MEYKLNIFEWHLIAFGYILGSGAFNMHSATKQLAWSGMSCHGRSNSWQLNWTWSRKTQKNHNVSTCANIWFKSSIWIYLDIFMIWASSYFFFLDSKSRCFLGHGCQAEPKSLRFCFAPPSSTSRLDNAGTVVIRRALKTYGRLQF